METFGRVSMMAQNTFFQNHEKVDRSYGWKNSVFIKSVADIKKLKNSKGSDIQVWGSSELIQLLLKNDLVDELRLKIHPLTLGKGKKLFDNGAIPAAFTLTESIVTPSGVIIANYKRAGKVRQVLLEFKAANMLDNSQDKANTHLRACGSVA